VIKIPLPDWHPEKWQCYEHTRAKHNLLGKYLKPWIYKMGKFKRIGYFDGFAGRGKYEDGTAGSPLIALRIANEHADKFDEFLAIFVEKDHNNYQNLIQTIEKECKDYSDKIKYMVVEGEFADVAENLIKKVGADLIPTFFFIDPFGFKGVPFETIKRILSAKKTEVFITFMYGFIKRFIGRLELETCIDELFGCEEWRDIVNTMPPDNIENALRDLYRKNLHERAGVKYTWSYRVCSPHQRKTKYYLIYATHHFAGLHLMKEIMYGEGAKGQFAYLGPEQTKYVPEQLKLHDFGGGSQEAELDKFGEYLLNRFKGKTLTYYEVKEMSYMETKFIDKHYRKVIRKLENNDLVKIERVPPFGKNGRPRTAIDDNCIITFPD